MPLDFEQPDPQRYLFLEHAKMEQLLRQLGEPLRLPKEPLLLVVAARVRLQRVVEIDVQESLDWVAVGLKKYAWVSACLTER